MMQRLAMADVPEEVGNGVALFCEHNFHEQICGKMYFFKTLTMKDSLFIWIGNGPNFDHLAISTPSRMVTTPPCATVLGEDVDNSHSPLAQKLSKRLKKQILLSCNVTSNEDVLRLLEKRIFEEFSKYPESF